LSRPKVSAVVPSYNHEEFLRRRLDSVFNQTFTDMEIILLDDASDDNCAEIMAEYADDPRVTHFSVNKKNSGSPFIQWKKGTDIATGEYLWIAESDDWAELTLLEELVPMLDADPSLGYVYCDTQVHGYPECKLTSEFNNRRFDTDRWSHDHRNNGVDEIRNYMGKGNTILSGSGVLYRTDVVKRMNAIDTRFRYVGDMYTFFKIMNETDLAYLAKPLNCYQHHGRNLTPEGFANGRSGLEMIAAYGPILPSYTPEQQEELIDSLAIGFRKASHNLNLTTPAVWSLALSELISSSPILRKVLWRNFKYFFSGPKD